jgi:hypothetical protein
MSRLERRRGQEGDPVLELSVVVDVDPGPIRRELFSALLHDPIGGLAMFALCERIAEELLDLNAVG